MPRSIFDVTGPTRPATGGRRSIFDLTAPPEDGVVAKVASVVPEPIKTTVGTVLDLVGRPGAATAGLVAGALSDEEGVEGSALSRAWENLRGRRRDDFDQVLEEQGYEDGFGRHAAGFVGDLVLDPLNLVGVGAVKKAVGGAAKGAGRLLGQGVEKVVPEGIQTAGKAVQDALGQKFVPRYGMDLTPEDIERLNALGRNITSPDEARDALRAFQKERSTIPTRVEKDIIERYKGTSPETRKAIQLALDEGAGKTDEIDALMLRQKALNEQLHAREVAAKVADEDMVRPDYAVADYSRTKGRQAQAMSNPNSAINARLRFNRKRKNPEMSMEEHISKGAEADVALAQLTREISGEKAILSGNFLQETAKRFGAHVKDAPDDWVTLKNLRAESPLAKEISEIAFPAYIARQLDKVIEVPKQATILGKLYDKALRIWRTQATVLRPGFHSTNLQGNMFNGALLAGALNPKRYVEAATWGKLKAAGFQGAPKIGKYTAQQVDDFMERFGVGGAGHSFTSELMEEGADKVLLQKLAGQGLSKNPIKHPIRAAKAVGGAIEDFSKRALFFDRLHKGDSLEDAAKTVDKYLFDYQDLTDFEKRVARRVFPFYTWMRKNVPLQAEQLLTQPHKYAAVSKTQNAIEGLAEERNTLTPEGERLTYLQEQNAIQLPTEQGEDKKYWTPYLPYQDLNKIPIPGGSGVLKALRDVGAGIDPGLKALVELGTNKSLFFDRQLYDEDLGILGDNQKINTIFEMLPDAVKRMLFTETVGRDGQPEFQTPAAVKYAVGQLPLMEAVGKSAAPITLPEDTQAPYGLLSPTLGVRVTNRTPKQESATRKAARQDDRRRKRKDTLQRRKPPKKAEVQSLWDRYLSEE